MNVISIEYVLILKRFMHIGCMPPACHLPKPSSWVSCKFHLFFFLIICMLHVFHHSHNDRWNRTYHTTKLLSIFQLYFKNVNCQWKAVHVFKLFSIRKKIQKLTSTKKLSLTPPHQGNRKVFAKISSVVSVLIKTSGWW